MIGTYRNIWADALHQLRMDSQVLRKELDESVSLAIPVPMEKYFYEWSTDALHCGISTDCAAHPSALTYNGDDPIILVWIFL